MPELTAVKKKKSKHRKRHNTKKSIVKLNTDIKHVNTAKSDKQSSKKKKKKMINKSKIGSNDKLLHKPPVAEPHKEKVHLKPTLKKHKVIESEVKIESKKRKLKLSEPSEDLVSDELCFLPKKSRAVFDDTKTVKSQKRSSNVLVQNSKNPEKSAKKRKLTDKTEHPVVKSAKTVNTPPDKETPTKTTETPEQKNERTVFVGNLPLDTDKKKLRVLFQSCGHVDTVRLRGAIGTKSGALAKKIATITKTYNESLKCMYAFVVFRSKSGVTNACKLNGTDFGNHSIRVDTCGKEKEKNTKYTVFLGNLPYDVTDDLLREHFDACGSIDYVRIIRDSNTGLGKGFGYIKFKDSSAFCLAMKMHSTKFQGRGLRVRAATTNPSQNNTISRKKKKPGNSNISQQRVNLKKREMVHQEKKIKKTGITQASNRVKSSFPVKSKKKKFKRETNTAKYKKGSKLPHKSKNQ